MSNSWSFAWLIEKKTTSIISIVELEDRSLEPVIRNWVCTARKGRSYASFPLLQEAEAECQNKKGA